jgi:DNA-binding transcriptional ArsR family regulator
LNIAIFGLTRYLQGMAQLFHPDADQIELGNVLAALGDDNRLAIIAHIVRSETGSAICSSFGHITSKSNLTSHIGKLREAGVVRVVPDGTRRIISLRRTDLDQRFPGLLDSILAGLPPGFGADVAREFAAEEMSAA